MIVDELIAILGYDFKDEGAVAKFNNGLNQAEKHAGAVSKRIDAITVAVGSFVGSMATMAVTKLADTIGSIPGDVIKVGKQFENYRLQLETLEGSSDKAEKALGWIKQFAQDTPLEMADVIEAYASLKNFGLDPTNGSLMALTDAMAASGKGKEQLSGLSLALGQAWAKEKLQGEEILQMVERGIPVWELLSKATGKSSAELQKLSAAGKLGRKEIDLLVKEIGHKYKGASEKFAKSFDGITSKLSDTWTMFLENIAERGIFKNVENRLQSLYDYIDRLSKNGSLDEWAKSINSGMEWALNTTIDTVGHLIGHFNFLTGWVKKNPDMFNNIMTGLKTLGAILFPRTFALLVLEDILTWMEGKESVIGRFAKQLSELTGIDPGNLGTILATLSGAGAAFLLFGGTFGTVAKGLLELSKAIKGLAVGSIASDLAASGTKSGAIFGKAFGKAVRLGLAGLGAWAAYEIAKDMPTTPEEWKKRQEENKKRDAATSNWIQTNIGDPVNKLLGMSLFREKGDFEHSPAKMMIDAFTSWLGPTPIEFISPTPGRTTGQETAKVVAVDNAKRARDAGYGRTTENLPGKTKDDLGTAPAPIVVVNPSDQATKVTAPEKPVTISTVADQIKAAGDRVSGSIAAALDGVNAAIPIFQPPKQATTSDVMAIDAARRARQFGLGRTTETMPGKTADDLGIGAKVMAALGNMNGHLAKMSGEAAVKAVTVTATDNSDRSVTTNTNVALTVQQINQAAAEAAKAVKEKVSGALSNVPASPARTMRSAHF
jgi:tape measure domain-containing protein